MKIVIYLDATKGDKPASAEKVSQWLGEALDNPDVRDSDFDHSIYSIEITKE